MKVLKAQAMGMCFGVKDAIERVMALPQPEETAIYGQLVHNEEVLTRLREKGLTQLEEDNRFASVEKPWLVITAHGISDREKKELLEKGEGTD